MLQQENTYKFAIALICSFVTVFPALCLAQSPAGADLDADGSAEFLLVDIAENQALDWSFLSATGASSSVASTTLGVVGDHLAVANWASATKSYLGYIRRENNKGYWNVVNEAGQTITRQFGGKSDVYVSGADFNGNGLADAAIIKTIAASSVLRWTIRQDFFRHIDGTASASSAKKNITFGKSEDLVFFANYSGSNDWLGVMREGANAQGVKIILRNPLNQRKRSFSVADYTLGSIRPLVIAKPSGGDIVALITKGSTSTVFRFFSLQGLEQGSVELAGTGEILVGNFLAAAGQEVAIQTDDGFTVYNPHSSEQVSVAVVEAIAVDDININTFESGGSEESCEDETLSPNDGNDKFLWKPISETTGKLVVVFPNQWTGKIASVVLKNPDDTLLETASRVYYYEHPGARTLARFSKRGSQYPNNVKVVARLNAGCLKTYVIPNPALRTD